MWLDIHLMESHQKLAHQQNTQNKTARKGMNNKHFESIKFLKLSRFFFKKVEFEQNVWFFTFFFADTWIYYCHQAGCTQKEKNKSEQKTHNFHY